MSCSLGPLAGLAVAVAVACPADAGQNAPQSPPPAVAALDLSRRSSPYDEAQALKAAGIARTSVERSFGRRGATASVGFLCGLQPDAVTRGAAAAYGVDPQGRFLGAQLRFGFR